jgi:hypothetical protein
MQPTPEQEIEAGEPTRVEVELFEQLGAGRVTGAPPGAPSDMTPVVEKTLRDLLGYLPRPTDPKGFVTALTRSYRVTEIEGVEQLTWTPRGYAIQADLGQVTGAQASIYTRAQEALNAARPLIEGVTPLVVDADPEAAEAIRRIVLYSFNQIVNELGSEGGPSVRFVDDLWIALLGTQAAPDGDPPTTPEEVEGQLGEMRERFALFRRYVNLVEEEQNYTNFVIVVDYVTSMYASWSFQRDFFLGRPGAGAAFFGTQLVLLSRALEVVKESAQDSADALDAVMIGKAERQLLNVDVGGSPIFLDGLLEWVSRFTQNDAPTLIQEAGRDGAISLGPALDTMTEAVAAFVPARDQDEFAARFQGFPPLYNTPLVAAALASLALALGEARRLVADLGPPEAVYRGRDVTEPPGVGVAPGGPAPTIDMSGSEITTTKTQVRGELSGEGFEPDEVRVLLVDSDDDEVATGDIDLQGSDETTLTFTMPIKALQPGSYALVLEQENARLFVTLLQLNND